MSEQKTFHIRTFADPEGGLCCWELGGESCSFHCGTEFGECGLRFGRPDSDGLDTVPDERCVPGEYALVPVAELARLKADAPLQFEVVRQLSVEPAPEVVARFAEEVEADLHKARALDRGDSEGCAWWQRDREEAK